MKPFQMTPRTMTLWPLLIFKVRGQRSRSLWRNMEITLWTPQRPNCWVSLDQTWQTYCPGWEDDACWSRSQLTNVGVHGDAMLCVALVFRDSIPNWLYCIYLSSFCNLPKAQVSYFHRSSSVVRSSVHLSVQRKLLTFLTSSSEPIDWFWRN